MKKCYLHMIIGSFEIRWQRCKKIFKIFTDIDLEQLDNLIKNENNINNLKIFLINEATKILHGEAASKKAEKSAKETFEGGGLGVDLPEIKIKSKEVESGINILDFITNHQILSSKSEGEEQLQIKDLKLMAF